MGTEFHIFASDHEQVFTVKQPGLYGSRVFASIAEATRYLREFSKDRDGLVVIHDEQSRRVNRIPLHIGLVGKLESFVAQEVLPTSEAV